MSLDRRPRNLDSVRIAFINAELSNDAGNVALNRNHAVHRADDLVQGRAVHVDLNHRVLDIVPDESWTQRIERSTCAGPSAAASRRRARHVCFLVVTLLAVRVVLLGLGRHQTGDVVDDLLQRIGTLNQSRLATRTHTIAECPFMYKQS